MADALFDLPAHVVADRVVWRRKMMRDHRLSYGARLYGGTLAFHRWGGGRVSWGRDAAARIMRKSPRTISRWNAELRDAGWLRLVEQGMPGRQQVFALAEPERQARKGDSRVTPRGKRVLRPALFDRSTPSGQAHSLASRILNATPAGQLGTPAASRAPGCS